MGFTFRSLKSLDYLLETALAIVMRDSPSGFVALGLWRHSYHSYPHIQQNLKRNRDFRRLSGRLSGRWEVGRSLPGHHVCLFSFCWRNAIVKLCKIIWNFRRFTFIILISSSDQNLNFHKNIKIHEFTSNQNHYFSWAFCKILNSFLTFFIRIPTLFPAFQSSK